MKTTKLTAEQAQQIEEALLRVEQNAEECMGDDGMVMVVPLDLYNELTEALSIIRSARAQEQAEQEPVSLHKVVEEHIADLRACVPTLRQYPEMASMTREVIKAANELEVALKSEQAEQEPVQKPFAEKWIDPNDKSQKQYLPHIGEKVLFCCDGEVYYGHHTGGSFQKGHGVTKSLFPTWDCMWMHLPAAVIAADREKNK